MSDEKRFVYLQKEGKFVRLAEGSPAQAGLEEQGFVSCTMADYWASQSAATLQHFLDLDAVDPTALHSSEREVVEGLLNDEKKEGGEEQPAEDQPSEEEADTEEAAPESQE